MSEQTPPLVIQVDLPLRLREWLLRYHARLGHTRDCIDSAWHREAWEALAGEEWPEEEHPHPAAAPQPAPAHTYCAVCSPGRCRCEEDRR